MPIHQHAIDPDHEIFSHWVSHAQAQGRSRGHRRLHGLTGHQSHDRPGMVVSPSRNARPPFLASVAIPAHGRVVLSVSLPRALGHLG
ncbi:hypothetical protein DSL92_08125 [Billgrantia gudaonensis]|uniref:Uncharacterized protein n=1 Tax=Billgrantia gudaonensis TaxID=376427 RepID=A0A3S0NGY5_9GAMM|nr:hypothetical protein DSL92_08125 [Halomonas gudaonensis]